MVTISLDKVFASSLSDEERTELLRRAEAKTISDEEEQILALDYLRAVLKKQAARRQIEQERKTPGPKR